MNYEEITGKLIQNIMEEYKLEKPYQEFLDSMVEFKDFNNVGYKEFKDYLDKLDDI